MGSATVSVSATNSAKVLIVEDSVPNRAILALLLRRIGFDVVECDNGDEAWRMIKATGEKFAAVLSDLMMPEVDGIELLRRVRADEQLVELPFVLVTAVSDREQIFHAKNLNANGYILKPITQKRIELKMRELFPDQAVKAAQSA
jgi:CheY-like chemotaxis protein